MGIPSGREELVTRVSPLIFLPNLASLALEGWDREETVGLLSHVTKKHRFRPSLLNLFLLLPKTSRKTNDAS